MAIQDNVGGFYGMKSPSTPPSDNQENGASFDIPTPSKSPSMPLETIDVPPKLVGTLPNDKLALRVDEVYYPTSPCTSINSSFIGATYRDSTLLNLTPLGTVLAEADLEEKRKMWLTASNNAELPLPCSYQDQDFEPSFDSHRLMVSLSPRLQRYLDIGKGDRARAYEFFHVMGQLHQFLLGFKRLGKHTMAGKVTDYLRNARTLLRIGQRRIEVLRYGGFFG